MTKKGCKEWITAIEKEVVFYAKLLNIKGEVFSGFFIGNKVGKTCVDTAVQIYHCPFCGDSLPERHSI